MAYLKEMSLKLAKETEHRPTPKKQRFSDETLAEVRESLVIGLLAGSQPHRFIGIWAVVVEKRVFVRSWSIKPEGWFNSFKKDKRGTVEIEGKRFSIRAVRTRSERLKKAVDQAYLEKYNTPASLKYVRDLNGPRSRATTTELVPD